MQTAARSSFIFTEFSSTEILTGLVSSKQGAFYQQSTARLFKGIYNNQFYNLAERLACIAHNAYTLRRMDVIEQVSLILQNLPLSREYKNVGSYYQALSMKKQGRITEACTLLESIVDHMPIRYRARGIQLLGMIHHAKGDFRSALTLYVDACKIAASNNWCDPHTTITAFQNIAVLESMNGNHKQAITSLERLFPVVRAISNVEPYKYHHYLNSYAVELGEVGRVEEAQNVCRIVLASPYAFAYPEWRETGQDLALRGYKSRSVVSVPKLPLKKKSNNVVPIPVNNNPSFIQQECAGVVDLKAWRDKMVKEPNGEDENLDEMDFNELVVKLLQLTTHEELSEKKLRKVVKSAIKIIEEKD